MGQTLEEQYRYRASEGDIQAEEIVDMLDFKDQQIKELYESLHNLVYQRKTQFNMNWAIQALTRIDHVERRVLVDDFDINVEEVSGE